MNKKEEVLSLISEIEQSIKHVNEMLDTNEVCRVSAYKSNSEFRKPPSQIHFSLPDISSQEIISEKFRKMFSDLLPLSFLIDEYKTENTDIVWDMSSGDEDASGPILLEPSWESSILIPPPWVTNDNSA